jgi:preprotein translocase subunit SecD
MRNLFHTLLAAAALFATRGYSATDTNSATLTFYVVSEVKIDGGRFIDTVDFPKLGYIATKPDLVITQLMAVTETVAYASMGTFDKDGKLTETPFDQPALDIQILPADAQKFESLTERAIGKRVVFMLGDMPLLAPQVMLPISTQTFQLTGERSGLKVIEDALKKLVH